MDMNIGYSICVYKYQENQRRKTKYLKKKRKTTKQNKQREADLRHIYWNFKFLVYMDFSDFFRTFFNYS